MIILAFFAFPIAVYCLILGLINRRKHPVLAHGSWDCLGLLLGLSGALLLAGPAILAGFFDREVRGFLLGGPRWGQVEFQDLLASWWPIWLVYYVVVLGGAVLLLWWRARVTVVYNIEPRVLDPLLANLFDQLGLEWTRLGNRIFLGFPGRGGRNSPLPRTDMAALVALPSQGEQTRVDQEEAVLDVEPFYAGRHVTLIWRSEGGHLRQEIEAELARRLFSVPRRANPAATWLLGIASALFALIIGGVGLILMFQIFRGP